ncbi:MAG TPA: hypothetical protein VI792_03270 [Candidatus Eisenbacteria bacterium]
MSLYDIGRQVEQEMRFAPQTAEWKRDLYTTIDRVHRELLLSRLWPFMLRQRPLILIPDSRCIVGLIASPALPGRTLGILPALGGFGLPAEMQVGGIEDPQTVLSLQLALGDGCEVHLDPSYRTAMLADATANWGMGPFKIEQMRALNQITLEPLASITTLPGPVSGAPLDHGQAVVVIKQPRVRLPPDCFDVLRVFRDDGVPLDPWSREEWIRTGYVRSVTAPFDGNDTGQTGTPRWILEDPGFEERVAGGRPDGVNEYQRYGAPLLPYNFAASGFGAGGTWPVGTWDVAFCWYSFGVPSLFGPLSEVRQFTTVLNNSVTLQFTPSLPSNDYGRQLAVFVRDASQPNRPFLFAGDSQADRTGNAKVLANPPQGVVTTPIDSSAAFRYEDVAGPYQHLRIFPRTDRLRRCVVEYQKRPRVLLDPQDEPDLPREHQSILVWLAAEALASRDDERFRETCREHAAKALGALEGRYPGARALVRKGSIMLASDRLPFIDRDNIRYTP